MIALMLLLSGCSGSGSSDEGGSPDTEKHEFVPINDSPDKYTFYIKDYVSRNCASVGYESLGGDRNDRYGSGYVHLIMITENGEYVGVSNEQLKNYVVVAQSLEPNTEIKFSYEKDEDGEEYDSLIEWQSISEIVLKVRPTKSSEEVTQKGMTAINPDPDRYVSYVKDYVGRNLASCGYISLGGDYRDHYGLGNIKLVIVPTDGSYIGLGEENIFDILKQYVVTGQSAAPNSEIKFKFKKDSDGQEYSWASWQSREEIELYVERLKPQN
jgi:hypothetical protein